MESTKKTSRTRTPRTSKKAAADSFKKLKILVTVVNRSNTEFFMHLLTSLDVNFQPAVLGQGTARSEMLYMLGLEDSDTGVIFSVLREDKAQEAMHALEDKFQTIKNGKGIAFTIPMSSVIGVAIYRFLSNHRAN